MDYFRLISVLSPLVGLGANVFFQVILFRTLLRTSLLKSVIFGFFIGLLFVFTLDLSVYSYIAAMTDNIPASLLTNFIIYGALGYGYFHFINLGETARRIRIIRELYDSQEGLSKEEILKRYNAKEIVKMRLNRLLGNHQIICKDGKYYIGNPTILIMAKTIIFLKYLVLGKKSEFD